MCMCKNGNINEGDEDMSAIAETKPIKSTEVTFDSEKEYEEFMELVKDPPATSEFVKDLIKQYQKQSEKK